MASFQDKTKAVLAPTAADCVSAAMLLDSFEVQLKVRDGQVEQAKDQLRKERTQLQTEISSLNQRIVEIEEIAYQLNEIMQRLGDRIREKEKENQVLRNSFQRWIAKLEASTTSEVVAVIEP